MQLLPLRVDSLLELRAPNLDQVKALFQVLEDHREELEHWIPWVKVMDTEKKVVRFIKESKAFNKGGQKLILFIYQQNKLVGSIGLLRIDNIHQKAEMGYWLSPEYQKQGIILKVCSYFIHFIFGHSPLQRIEIKTSSGNHKSKAIPLKLGFQHTETLLKDICIDGEYHDIEIFSLLKKDLGKI